MTHPVYSFSFCRGVRGAHFDRQLPGTWAQVRQGLGHRRRGQEGQPVGRRQAQLHHGKGKNFKRFKIRGRLLVDSINQTYVVMFSYWSKNWHG